MPTYKLTYFNARARGETSRLLFAAAKVEFEDERIEMEDWPKVKETTPQGSVPVLLVDGTMKICQSLSIARHLAREFNLYGKTNKEAVIIDQIIDTGLDLFDPFMPMLFLSPDEQAKKFKEFFEEKGVKKLEFIKNLMSTGKNGFCVGDSLTVADLYIFAVLESVINPIAAKLGDKTLLEKFPEIEKMKETVANLPRIKDYLSSRKETPF